MPHTTIDIPARLPLHTQKDAVVFPYMLFPLYVSEKDVATFREADNYEKYVVLAFDWPDDPKSEHPVGRCEIATLCKVNQIKKLDNGRYKVSLEGVTRLQILDTEPFVELTLAHCEIVREFVEKNLVSEALVQSLNALLKISLSHGKPLPDDVMKMIDYIDNPARLSDLVALYVNLPTTDLQELLETTDPLERLKKVYVHLTNEVQRMQIKNEKLELRPGQYGTVEIARAARKVIVVPRDAVVDTGKVAYVFVDGGNGNYTPRVVQLGSEADDLVELRAGVVAGERVVSGATFLVDSESRLRASLAPISSDAGARP